MNPPLREKIPSIVSRITSFSGSSRNSGSEKHLASTSTSLDVGLLKACFHAPEEAGSPGCDSLRAYLKYLQQQIYEHQSSVDRAVKAFIGAEPVDDQQRFSFVSAVASEFNADSARERTLEEVVLSLYRLYGVPHAVLPVKEATQAVFLVLGWVSALFKPHPGSQNDPDVLQIACSTPPYRCRSHPVILAKRPISCVTKTLGVVLPSDDTRRDRVPGTLQVSNLNFASLKVIGRVRVSWVDVLSDHLNFEASTRTLHLFRFPSLCAFSRPDGQVSSFDRLLSNYYSAENGTDLSMAYRREVLLSYRVIFGQAKSSRKLFGAMERRRAEGTLELCDPLLVNLCGHKRLDPSLMAEHLYDFMAERCHRTTAFSSEADFPLFGQKLESIQRYNNRQRPNQFRDMWRDRRDPLQWYTVWAVLIIAAVSLVLSLISTAATVLQVWLAFGSQR